MRQKRMTKSLNFQISWCLLLNIKFLLLKTAVIFIILNQILSLANLKKWGDSSLKQTFKLTVQIYEFSHNNSITIWQQNNLHFNPRQGKIRRNLKPRTGIFWKNFKGTSWIKKMSYIRSERIFKKKWTPKTRKSVVLNGNSKRNLCKLLNFRAKNKISDNRSAI